MTLNVVNTGHERTADCNVTHGTQTAVSWMKALCLLNPSISPPTRQVCLFSPFQLHHLLRLNAKTLTFNVSLVCRNVQCQHFFQETGLLRQTSRHTVLIFNNLRSLLVVLMFLCFIIVYLFINCSYKCYSVSVLDCAHIIIVPCIFSLQSIVVVFSFVDVLLTVHFNLYSALVVFKCAT